MNKYLIFAASILLTGAYLSMSGIINAAPPPPPPPPVQTNPPSLPPLPPLAGQDVADILYQVKRDLHKQEGRLEAGLERLTDAREAYLENPNPSTYNAVLKATATDTSYLSVYSELVEKAQALLSKAKEKYYEDTPVTKTEMAAGPEGESLDKEMKETEVEIIADLTREVDAAGGQSVFAKALQEQATKLKATKDKVEKEQSTVAQGNPEAEREDSGIKNALSNAIGARMEVLFCANHSKKECCERYKNHKNCKVN